VSLERLWAGWRATYVSSAIEGDDDGCVLCRLAAAAAADADEAMIVHRGELALVVMNAYPYTSGHVMVAPLRHEGALDGLTDAEAAEIMDLSRAATTALKAAFTPDGVNVGMNEGRAAGAGVPGHVHVHALPRWFGDTNFTTSVAETRVLPEDLRTSFERLRAAWPH